MVRGERCRGPNPHGDGGPQDVYCHTASGSEVDLSICCLSITIIQLLPVFYACYDPRFPLHALANSLVLVCEKIGMFGVYFSEKYSIFFSYIVICVITIITGLD